MSPIAIPEVEQAAKAGPIKQKLRINDWIKPAITKADLDWAQLQEVDLCLLDSDNVEVRAKLVEQARKALTSDGFLFVTGTGVTTETLERNLAIAQYLTSGLSREEKEPYAADLGKGSYRGYKLRGIWNRDGGVPDNIEHYNLESPSFEPGAEHPEKIEPLLPEIQAFAEHTYRHVVYRILKLVSLALELPEDYLWNLHEHNGAIGHAAHRYMAYYPRSEEDEEKSRDTWTKGHTDYNSISLLYSQPVTALQILDSTGQWKWVKHVEGAVVVNTADALDFVTGGVFKATRHRVIRPPRDQAGVIRYILIHFARFRRDLVLDPIWASPVVKAHGKHAFQAQIDAGGSAPTQDEWLRERIRRTGNELYENDTTTVRSKEQGQKVVEEVLGRKVEYFV